MKRWERFYAAIRRIPSGKVATYGQIAALAGLDGHARQVGYALHALPSGSDVPWHRVINARGEVSQRTAGDSHELQRKLLEAEGVRFNARGRVAMKEVQWEIRARSESPRPRGKPADASGSTSRRQRGESRSSRSKRG